MSGCNKMDELRFSKLKTLVRKLSITELKELRRVIFDELHDRGTLG